MNYRHAYHTGNFADVMKHLTLVRVIEHLKLKKKPFRFIDTHAGAGLYDLGGDEAQRSDEWRTGIGALLTADTLEPSVALSSGLEELVQPYFDAVRSFNVGAVPVVDQAPLRSGQDDCSAPATVARRLGYYPGSGLLARHLLRADDRMVLNELHPEDVVALRRSVGRDQRVRILDLDGWTVVKSTLPPKERRGVLLIDPPFELAGEFKRLEAALGEATSRFATGVSLLWYPIKAGGASENFVRQMTKAGHKRLLCAELLIRHRDHVPGLNGSGLLIHNPPYGLDVQLETLLGWLGNQLGAGAGASSRVEWLAGE